jgi:small subunit ribosomal protein S16
MYRVVVVDSRKKRDGKVIEIVGTYNPNTDPSTIDVKTDRVQYWLSVGAKTTDVTNSILKLTGDIDKYKGSSAIKNKVKEKEITNKTAERIKEIDLDIKKALADAKKQVKMSKTEKDNNVKESAQENVEQTENKSENKTGANSAPEKKTDENSAPENKTGANEKSDK